MGGVRLPSLRYHPAGQKVVIQEVLEPLEHSVLDHADPAGQHAVIQEVLEPLEHSVLDADLDGRPMEGIPVLDALEHSVLEMALDGGPLEEMSNLEPLEHSVLIVALDGRPMKGIPVLEPLGHSVLIVALDGRPMEGIPVLKPLGHSVLELALDGGHLDSSRARQRVSTWPDFPHEKQTTPFQSCRMMGRCGVGGLMGCCPERYDRNNFSNPTGSGGLTTGGGRLCVSATRRCNNFSTAGTSGTGAGTGTGAAMPASNRRSMSSTFRPPTI